MKRRSDCIYLRLYFCDFRFGHFSIHEIWILSTNGNKKLFALFSIYNNRRMLKIAPLDSQWLDKATWHIKWYVNGNFEIINFSFCYFSYLDKIEILSTKGNKKLFAIFSISNNRRTLKIVPLEQYWWDEATWCIKRFING